MKIKVYSKDINIPSEAEERIGSKFTFLDKYFMIDPDTTGQVRVKKHQQEVKVELTIPTKVGYLRSEIVSADMDDAIDLAIKKIEEQVRRQKYRLSRRHKEKLAKSFVIEDQVEEAIEEKKEKVAKVKRLVVDEIDTEEAILQMELTGHDFFIYKDETSKLTCVIYKRKDGDYGIIEVA